MDVMKGGGQSMVSMYINSIYTDRQLLTLTFKTHFFYQIFNIRKSKGFDTIAYTITTDNDISMCLSLNANDGPNPANA